MSYDVRILCSDNWDLANDRWLIEGSHAVVDSKLTMSATEGACVARPFRYYQLWQPLNLSYNYYRCFKHTVKLTDAALFEFGLNNGDINGLLNPLPKIFSIETLNGLAKLDSTLSPVGSFNGTNTASANTEFELRIAFEGGDSYGGAWTSFSSSTYRAVLIAGSSTFDTGWVQNSEFLKTAYSPTSVTRNGNSFRRLPFYRVSEGSATLGPIIGYAPTSMSECEEFLTNGTLATTACAPVVATVSYLGTNHLAKLTMTCATPGSKIRYSIDSGALGENPAFDYTSEDYVEPLYFNKNASVRAFAQADCCANSPIISTFVSLNPSVLPVPEICPYSESLGCYPGYTPMAGINAKGFAPDAASVIRYTLDGSDPTASSPVMGPNLWVPYVATEPVRVLKAKAFKGAVESAVAIKRLAFAAHVTPIDTTTAASWSTESNASFSASGMTVSDTSGLGVVLKHGLAARDVLSVQFTVTGDFVFGYPGSNVTVRSIGGKFGVYNEALGGFISSTLNLAFPAKVKIANMPGYTVCTYNGNTVSSSYSNWGTYDPAAQGSSSSTLVCFTGAGPYTVSSMTLLEGLMDDTYHDVAPLPTSSVPPGYYTTDQSPTVSVVGGNAICRIKYSTYNGYIPLNSKFPTMAFVQGAVTGKSSSPMLPMKFFTHPDPRAWCSSNDCYFDFARDGDTTSWYRDSTLSFNVGVNSREVGHGACINSWGTFNAIDVGSSNFPWLKQGLTYIGPELDGATNIWYAGVLSWSHQLVDMSFGLGFDLENNKQVGLSRHTKVEASPGDAEGMFNKNGMLDIVSYFENNDAMAFLKTSVMPRNTQIKWACGRKGTKDATQVRVQFFNAMDDSVVYDSGWSEPVSLSKEAKPRIFMKYRVPASNSACAPDISIDMMFGYKNLTDDEMTSLFQYRSLTPVKAPVAAIDSSTKVNAVSVTAEGVSRLVVNNEGYPMTTVYSGSVPPAAISFNKQSYVGTPPGGPRSVTNLTFSDTGPTGMSIRAVSDRDCDPYYIHPSGLTLPLARSSAIEVRTAQSLDLLLEITSNRSGYVSFAPKRNDYTLYSALILEFEDGSSMVMTGQTGVVTKRLAPGPQVIKAKTLDLSYDQRYYASAYIGAGRFAPYTINVASSGSMTVTAPASVVANNPVAISVAITGGIGNWTTKIEAAGQTFEGTSATVTYAKVGMFAIKVSASDSAGNFLVDTVYVAVNPPNPLANNLVGKTPEKFT